jgi:hypothetical protein
LDTAEAVADTGRRSALSLEAARPLACQDVPLTPDRVMTSPASGPDRGRTRSVWLNAPSSASGLGRTPHPGETPATAELNLTSPHHNSTPFTRTAEPSSALHGNPITVANRPDLIQRRNVSPATRIGEPDAAARTRSGSTAPAGKPDPTTRRGSATLSGESGTTWVAHHGATISIGVPSSTGSSHGRTVTSACKPRWRRTPGTSAAPNGCRAEQQAGWSSTAWPCELRLHTTPRAKAPPLLKSGPRLIQWSSMATPPNRRNDWPTRSLSASSAGHPVEAGYPDRTDAPSLDNASPPSGHSSRTDAAAARGPPALPRYADAETTCNTRGEAARHARQAGHLGLHGGPKGGGTASRPERPPRAW